MEFPHTVNDQSEFDALINQRLARAKAQWESEGGVSEAKQRAAEAEARADAAEAQARERIGRRDARVMLKDMGVSEMARQDRIMRLADFSAVNYDEQGEPSEKDIRDALKGVYQDVPEIFGEGVQVVDSPADAGQDTGVGDEVPITSEEQLEKMGPDEINSSWDRVAAFLRGER